MSILDDLRSVADAIRSKTGKTDKMMLAEMPGEMKGLPEEVKKRNTTFQDLSCRNTAYLSQTILRCLI